MKTKRTRLLIVLLLIQMVIPQSIINMPVYADEVNLNVVESSTYIAGLGAQAVDNELTVSYGDNIYSAKVYFEGSFSSDDSMEFETVGGLSASYDTGKGILSIEGSASDDTYQEFLRKVKFSTPEKSGTREVVVLLNNSESNALYYAATGHFYEFVESPRITWEEAKVAAEQRIYMGHHGYLATILSDGENDFMRSKCSGAGWLGGSDENQEDVWEWVTGPDVGKRIDYSNWAENEPNDFNAGEDHLHMFGGNSTLAGQWNDYYKDDTNNIRGYIVEYGMYKIDIGTGGSAKTTINIVDDVTPPTDPTITLNSDYVEGSWSPEDVPFTVGGSTDNKTSQNEIKYLYSLDGGTSWSTEYTNVIEESISETGEFTLQAKAKDAAGNYSNAVSKIVKVDKTKPEAFTIDASATGTDSIDVSGTTSDLNVGMHDSEPYRFNDGSSWTDWGTETSKSFSDYTPNQRVDLKMEAKDILGNVRLVSRSIYTLAAVPEIAEASPQRNGDVILTIDEKNNASDTRYYVEASINSDFSNGFTASDWINPDGDEVTIPKGTVDPATIYYFKVKAKNGDEIETEFGEEAPSALTVPEIPNAPSVDPRLTTGVSEETNKEIYLLWNAVTGADSYDVYETIDNVEKMVENVSTNEATRLNLIPNTNYSYRITSRNTSGDCLESPSTSDVTFAMVSDIKELVPLSNGNVDLIVNEYRNSSVTEYYVDKTIDPSFAPESIETAQEWINPGADSTITIDNLEKGTTYYFRINARNTDLDETVWGADWATVITIPGKLTPAPSVTVDSSSQTTISWTPVVGAYSYDVYRNNTFLKRVSETTTNDTYLNPNEIVIYKVIARNSSGTGEQSDNSIATYTEAVVPNYTLEAKENGNIDIIIDPNGNAPGTNYVVEYSEEETFASPNTLHSTETTRTATGLSYGATYYFRVKAINNVDVETAWTEVKEKITVLAKLGTPTVEPVSSTELDVTWEAVDGADSYKVYRGDVEIATVTEATYSDSELKANCSYEYKITAVNAGGESIKSDSASRYTLAEHPTSIKVLDKTESKIKFKLEPSPNLVNNASYNIELRNAANGEVVKVSAWSPNIYQEITGLDNTTEYEVWIYSKNEEGNVIGPIKLLEGVYCNRPVISTISNQGITIMKSEVEGNSSNFIISGKVYDLDGEKVTVSATLNGIEITQVIDNVIVSEPGEDNFGLNFDVWSLEEGEYSNIDVLIKDEYDSIETISYTGTLIVDKTEPVINIIGDEDVYLEIGEAFENQGATANDAGSGLVGDVTSEGVADIDTSAEGVYTITYKAVDKVGNEATKTRTVNVVTEVALGTVDVENIGKTVVELYGNIKSLGREQRVLKHGFVWSDSSIEDNADLEAIDTKNNLGSGIDTDKYSADISGLTGETTYYVRAYAETVDETVVYGEEVTFDTIDVDKERIAFSEETFTHSETEGTVSITVDRSVVTDTEVTVDYAIESGTATSGGDYTLTEGTLTFAAGEESKSFDIDLVNDEIYEEDETILLKLENASEDVFITKGSTEITVTSDDLKNSDNAMTSFSLKELSGEINNVGNTVNLTVPNGSDITNLKPVVKLPENASISPVSSMARDFTNPVAYTVTAQDGTTRRYIVKVEISSSISNVDLLDIEVRGAGKELAISPAFASDVTSYTSNVSNSVDKVTISPIVDDDTATITVNGKVVISGETSSNISMREGKNTIEVKVTALDTTAKSYKIVITRKEKVKSSGGGGGINTSGGSNSPKQDIDGDSEINKTNGKSSPTINLSEDRDAKASITLKTVEDMKDANKTFTVENNGIKIAFKPDSIVAKEVKEGLEKELNKDLEYENVEVILGVKALSYAEKNIIIEKSNVGKMKGITQTSGKVFDITANIVKEKNGIKEEEKIKHFNEPVEVTLDLKGMELSEQDIEKLTAIRYERNMDGDIIPVKMGGKYDRKTKTFTFHTDTTSLCGVVKSDNLLEINLNIGEIDAEVNKEMKRNDVAPIIINNRTMVPVRFIAENMGAKVAWNEVNRVVTIEIDGKTMSMVIDREMEGFDTPPVIIGDRTFVPVRYVSEKFDANVMWFPKNQKVHIVK